MDKEVQTAITEAYRVFQLLDDEAKEKIPQGVKEYLEKNKDLSLGEPLSVAIPLEMQEISKEGWNVIAYLATFLGKKD